MTSIRHLLLYLFISVFFLQSCSKHQPAPVEELSNSKNKKYTYKRHSKIRYKRDHIKVKKGDTLYSIGFANNLDYKKLAMLNNIKPPYRIYPGQKIKLKGRVTVLTKNPIPTVTKTKKKQPISNNNNKSKTQKPITVTKKPVIKNSSQKPMITTVVKKTAPHKTLPKAQPKTTVTSKVQWIWPVKGRILSSFSSTDTSRKGIKIAVAFGKSVYASNNGTVVYSGDGLRGYGELIIIKHSNNMLSAYAHNSKRFVKEGQTVSQGQEIAKSGKGNDGKPLLHFEIRKNGQPVNPVKYLPK